MAEEKSRPESRQVVVVLPAIQAPKWLQGFVNFVREQGVVGIAIGLTVGLAAKSLVDSFVQNVVNPLAGMLYGGGQLAEKTWCLKSVGTKCTNPLSYGSFLNALINFIIILAIVYFVVKRLKLDRLDKTKK
ncbi:MAG TPA: MscL family protein [Candidatus Saccharimonadales bacterium]|nr:MscL family protein [Candidatus Saccharimonadales bacterium]